LAIKQRSTAWLPVASTTVMFQGTSPRRIIPAHLFQLEGKLSPRISGSVGGALRPVQSPENLVSHLSRKQINTGDLSATRDSHLAVQSDGNEIDSTDCCLGEQASSKFVLP